MKLIPSHKHTTQGADMTSDSTKQWNTLIDERHKLQRSRIRFINMVEKSLTRRGFAAILKNKKSSVHTVAMCGYYGEDIKDLEGQLWRCEKSVDSPVLKNDAALTMKVLSAFSSRNTHEHHTQALQPRQQSFFATSVT
jgi:hypothetical protein